MTASAQSLSVGPREQRSQSLRRRIALAAIGGTVGVIMFLLAFIVAYARGMPGAISATLLATVGSWCICGYIVQGMAYARVLTSSTALATSIWIANVLTFLLVWQLQLPVNAAARMLPLSIMQADDWLVPASYLSFPFIGAFVATFWRSSGAVRVSLLAAGGLLWLLFLMMASVAERVWVYSSSELDILRAMVAVGLVVTGVGLLSLLRENSGVRTRRSE